MSIFAPSSLKRPRPQPLHFGALAGICALACGFIGACARTENVDDALTVLLPREPQEIDPRLTGDSTGLKISRLLFASLVRIDPATLEPIPELAERVEFQSPVEVVVRLRDGLRFSDGSVLDSEDVIETYRGVVDQALGSRYAQTYRRIVSMDAVDAHTVLFHLSEPHATFLTDLEMPIVRAEDARRPIAQVDGAMPVGAGPYVLVQRAPGRLLLSANAHWHRGRVAWPKIEMLVVRDDNTRALRMLSGDADVVMNAMSPMLVPMFEHRPAFAVRSAAGTNTTYLGFNLDSPALGDLSVRRAMTMAIDRAALVASKLGGHGQVADSWIPPGHWAASASLPRVAFEPARARTLLSQLNARRDVMSRPITLRCSSDRPRVSIARAIAAMLRDVGLTVEVRPSETASLLADLDAGRFEIALMQMPELIEPHVLSWFFGSDHIPGAGVSGANRWRLRDAAVDKLLESGRRHMERSERVFAYHALDARLAATLPVFPLWHEDVIAVLSHRASAIEVPRDGRFATLAALQAR
jgi:peptide/nickel transport system substrate-binding protein